MSDTRKMTPEIRNLFLLSERIHHDAMRHAEEMADAKRIRDMRACKRTPIGTDARVLRTVRGGAR